MNLAERLSNCLNKTTRSLLGVMSGMSLDGIDIAHLECEGRWPDISVKFKGSYYEAYPDSIRKQLRQIEDASVQEISKLNFDLARLYSQAIKAYLTKQSLTIGKIDAIGLHGQTVFHKPRQHTLQLGSGCAVAQMTKIPVVSDFRSRDVAAHGEGAPFVPVADAVFYGSNQRDVVLHNLGSISNVSVIKKGRSQIWGFDCGPANMILDILVQLDANSTESFDKDGELARAGRLNEKLLETWLSHSYFQAPPPKSLGYSEFGLEFVKSVIQDHGDLPYNDLLRTAVEFTVQSTAQAYKDFVLPKSPDLKQVYISGGGIHNAFLMERLRDTMSSLEFLPPPRYGDDFADYKEAAAFAVLAHLTLNGEPGNAPLVTGASEEVVLGQIAL